MRRDEVFICPNLGNFPHGRTLPFGQITQKCEYDSPYLSHGVTINFGTRRYFFISC